MQTLSPAILKLKPVLDLTEAETLLVALRQQLDLYDEIHVDASAVEVLTTPCVQIIMAAGKSCGGMSIVSPSEEFTSAFADLGVTFPLAATQPTPAGEASDTMPPDAMVPDATPEVSAPVSEQPEEATAMAKRILTIDDSKTIRDMLRMTLVDAGFEVLQAVDGQDGVDVMEREHVDLVITDINMPKMNGYEVVRHLRSNPAHKGLPILMLTTESDTDKKKLAREAGATGWMVKPFDPDRLIATVRKVIP